MTTSVYLNAPKGRRFSRHFICVGPAKFGDPVG